MRISVQLLLRRGWLRFPHEQSESSKLIKYGKLKWRDYQSKYVDPPYWYKWGRESPYMPEEQNKILQGKHLGWYQFNYHKLKTVAPDEWLFKVGDQVEILAGKDKGKQGEIVVAHPEGNVIFVGGLNCKHQFDEGTRSLRRVEKPLHHHELSLLDPKDAKPVEVEFKVNKEGQRVRVSTRSGHTIPWPPELLADGTRKDEYTCGDKDTNIPTALERSFLPTMESWEEELKNVFKVEDPPRRKTYWY